MWKILTTFVLAVLVSGCAEKPKPYGIESRLEVPEGGSETWAVAPVLNLTGQREVDPILQADLVYQQLQTVTGMTAVPVDRVAQIFASMQIQRVSSSDEAALACDLLGVKAILVPTVTVYDPYDPPKMAATLTLFRKPEPYYRPPGADAAEMTRNLEAGSSYGKVPRPAQAVGMFDAADGSVRQALQNYAAGRHDPNGPTLGRGYMLEMDRYSGFVYHALIEQVLKPADLTQ